MFGLPKRVRGTKSGKNINPAHPTPKIGGESEVLIIGDSLDGVLDEDYGFGSPFSMLPAARVAHSHKLTPLPVSGFLRISSNKLSYCYLYQTYSYIFKSRSVYIFLLLYLRSGSFLGFSPIQWAAPNAPRKFH